MRKEFLTLGAALAAASLVVPSAVAATASDRLAGSDRFETAIQIAETFGTSDTVYLARGDNQADAVAGGKLTGGPLLLVNENTKTQYAVAATVKKLQAKHVVVLGGTGAVSEATVKAVAGDTKVTRIAGANRFETAAEVSRVLTVGKSAPKVYLANGYTLVDALVGGTIKDKNNEPAPILLTNGSGVLPLATVGEIKRLKPTEIVALGGSSAVRAEELNAAASVNGAGGGLSEDAAKAKVTEDLEKEVRLAQMQLDGWYTVASGYSVEAFLKSECTKVAKDAKDSDKTAAKKALELTFPRVLPDEVNQTCTARIFKVDGSTRDGSLADAEKQAAALAKVDSKDVDTFVGLEKAAEYAKAAADEKAIAEAETKAKAAYDEANKADKKASTDETKKKLEETKKAYEEAQKDAKNAKTTEAKLLDKATALTLEQAKGAFKEASDALKNVKDPKATPSEKVARLLQAAMGAGGAKTSRLSGANRYLTALAIARAAYPSGGGAKMVYAANGDASADATVAGFIDNKDGLAGPVLLVSSYQVPNEVEAYLKDSRAATPAIAGKFKALGGTAVVSDTVVDTVKGLLK